MYLCIVVWRLLSFLAIVRGEAPSRSSCSSSKFSEVVNRGFLSFRLHTSFPNLARWSRRWIVVGSRLRASAMYSIDRPSRRAAMARPRSSSGMCFGAPLPFMAYSPTGAVLPTRAKIREPSWEDSWRMWIRTSRLGTSSMQAMRVLPSVSMPQLTRKSLSMNAEFSVM